MNLDKKRLEKLMRMSAQDLINEYFWSRMTLKEKIKHYLKKVERGLLFSLKNLVPVVSIIFVLITHTPVDPGINIDLRVKELINQIQQQLPQIEKEYKELSAFGGAIAKQKASLNEDQAFVYAFLITKYAKQYGLDPHLVAGVMATESEFNPKAVSSAKAKGLMQIHQPAWKLSDKTLFDEEENIKHGARILFYYKNSNPNHFLRFYGGFADKNSKEAERYESKVKGNAQQIRLAYYYEKAKDKIR